MPNRPPSISSICGAHVSFGSSRLFDWQQLACQCRGSQGRRGGSREWRRETQRREGSRKTFLIQRDMQCFHGNSVPMDTVLLKMPFVWKNTYLHKYWSIYILKRQDCIFQLLIWERRRVAFLQSFNPLTHLRSIIMVQLQATNVSSSIIGLAPLGIRNYKLSR